MDLPWPLSDSGSVVFMMQLQHGTFRLCVPARVAVFSVFVDPDALHHMFGLDAKLNPRDVQRVNS